MTTKAKKKGSRAEAAKADPTRCACTVEHHRFTTIQGFALYNAEFFIDGFETNTIEQCIALQSSWTHAPRAPQPESDHDSSRGYPHRVLRRRALKRYLSPRS